MSLDPVLEVARNCKENAQQLRKMAQDESCANVKKLLLEAGHQLDVAMAELDYILTNSTVSI